MHLLDKRENLGGFMENKDNQTGKEFKNTQRVNQTRGGKLHIKENPFIWKVNIEKGILSGK